MKTHININIFTHIYIYVYPHTHIYNIHDDNSVWSYKWEMHGETVQHQLPHEGCNLAMLSEAQHLYNMKWIYMSACAILAPWVILLLFFDMEIEHEKMSQCTALTHTCTTVCVYIHMWYLQTYECMRVNARAYILTSSTTCISLYNVIYIYIHMYIYIMYIHAYI